MIFLNKLQGLLIHIAFYCHISTFIFTAPLINFSPQISQITMLTFYSTDYLIVVNSDKKIITYQISNNKTQISPFGTCLNAYYYQDMYVYGGGDNSLLYNALFNGLKLQNYNSYSQLSYTNNPLKKLVVLSGQDNVVSIKQDNTIQWMYQNNKIVTLTGCTGQFNGLISFKQSKTFLALCGFILIQWDQQTAVPQINASVVIIQPPIIVASQYLQILQLQGSLGDSLVQDFILVENDKVTICNYSSGQVTRKQATQLTSTPYQVLISQWRFFYIDSSKTNIYFYEILNDNTLIQRSSINGSFTLSTMSASPDNTLLAYADQTSISVWQYTQGICQTGFIWSTVQNICNQCLYYCQSCSQSQSQCDACQISSNSQNTYRQGIQNNCKCQDGYYDNGSLICVQCPYNCKTCTKNTQGTIVCQTCLENSFRNQNESCSCMNGYYDNGTSICQKCDQTCLTCQIISTQLQCTQCDPNSFRKISAGKCICQDGYQEYSPQQSKCISSACFSTCKTCTQPQDQYSCSSCSADRTLVQLQNGKICQCNPNSYEDQLVCKLCDSTCMTCNGGNSNNCLSCDQSLNRQFDTKTNSCICQDGYFEQSGKCVQCDKTCQTCSGSGPQNCLSCFQTQNRNLSQNQCICNQGFVSVNNNLICQQCADNCQICDISSPLKCQTCLPNTNRILNVQTGNCDCQSGYFQNGKDRACSQCDTSCKTCSSSSKNCLSCSDPLKNLQGNTCVCQESYFQLYPNDLCQKCSANCLKCSDSNSCTKCQPNFELSNNNQCTQIIPSNVPKETLHLVQNSTKTTIYASVGSTVAGSILLSSFQPNSSIATQLLLLQKFNFMLLINISYPQLLHQFFIIFGGTSPISSLQKYNIIDKYLVKNESSPVYISDQFSQEDVSDNILKNSGGCVVIIVVFWFICLPFIILYKKNTTIRNAEEIKQSSTKLIKNIGEEYYPYILVLIHQVLSLIIFFSVFLQIAAFIKFDPVSDSLFIPKIILLIIEGTYIFLIFGKSLFIVNQITNYQQDVSLHSTEKIEQSIYSNINLNQKGDSFFRRNYKLIQIIIENILIPIFIIFIGFDSKIQIGLCLGFYVLLFILTAATNPMNKFIDNLFLIIDQSCWIILYSVIFFIAEKLSYIQDLTKMSDSDIELFTILSWVGVGSCIIILLLNPIYLIALLITLRKEYLAKIKEICNKIKQKCQKNENQDLTNITNYDNVSLYDFTLRNTSKLWDRSTIHQQQMLEKYRSIRQLQSNSSSIFNSPPLLSQVKKIKLNKQIDIQNNHEIELPSKSLSHQPLAPNQLCLNLFQLSKDSTKSSFLIVYQDTNNYNYYLTLCEFISNYQTFQLSNQNTVLLNDIQYYQLFNSQDYLAAITFQQDQNNIYYLDISYNLVQVRLNPFCPSQILGIWYSDNQNPLALCSQQYFYQIQGASAQSLSPLPQGLQQIPTSFIQLQPYNQNQIMAYFGNELVIYQLTIQNQYSFESIVSIDTTNQSLLSYYQINQLIATYAPNQIFSIYPFDNSQSNFLYPAGLHIISTMPDTQLILYSVQDQYGYPETLTITRSDQSFQNCSDSSVCQPLCSQINDSSVCQCFLAGQDGYCKCKQGYYKHPTLGCQKCPYFCQTCDSGSICTSCPINSNRMQFTDSNICACLSGYQDDSNLEICYQCDDSCLTCNGPNKNNWQNNLSNQISLIFFSLTCKYPHTEVQNGVCQCLSRYYKSANNQCSQCNPSCKTCLDGSFNGCLTCNQDNSLIRSSLVSQSSSCICKDRYYQSSDLTTCLQCHATCLNCIDSQINSCVSCDTSSNFIRSNTQTQTSQCICKEGYYLNNFQCSIDYCYVGCSDCNNQTKQCLKCENKYQQNLTTTECTLTQITEIQETYQINNSTTYQKMESVVVGSAILAVSSPGVNFSKQFLTIQKLNFIFIIDITYNEYIYLFMQSIVGQNPLNKLQKINFLSNSWFEESQDSLNSQILTKKVGQTSIIYNAGGVFACILICLAFCLPIILIQQSTSQIDTLSQTNQPSSTEKIKGYYQMISLNAINFFNDLMCQIIFFAENFLEIINKISLSLIVIFVVILLSGPIISIFKVIQMIPTVIQKVKEYLEKKKEESKNKLDNQKKEDFIENNLNFQDFANSKSVNSFDNQLLEKKSVQISNDQLDQDQI
ncbi:hypothetical protein ABPG73_003923 [Tetrahymena malaccensis]